MATRYSGPLTINVVYDDRGDYRSSVSEGGRVLWRGRVRPPPSGFGSGIAYDSEHAYDDVARAALSFASSENSDIGDQAETDGEGYKVRRVKNFHQKWPPGQIRPRRLPARDPRRSRNTADNHLEAIKLERRARAAESAGKLSLAQRLYRQSNAAYRKAGIFKKAATRTSANARGVTRRRRARSRGGR